MRKPAMSQIDQRDRLKRQRRRSPDLQLAIDLRGHLRRDLAIRADTWPTPLSLFVIVEIPDAAPQVALDPADSELIRTP